MPLIETLPSIRSRFRNRRNYGRKNPLSQDKNRNLVERKTGQMELNEDAKARINEKDRTTNSDLIRIRVE